MRPGCNARRERGSRTVTVERSPEAGLDVLYTQARCLWGEEDAEQQRPALQQTAEEIATMVRYDLPPDLEPRFF
jgi:hypothetical protein